MIDQLRSLGIEKGKPFSPDAATQGALNAGVARQIAKWAEKTGLAIKPPSNVAEAMIQCEVRAHLATMKGSKLGFLEQYATNPLVASAILAAPKFLSGLTDAEVIFVKQRAEQHVSPEIAEARAATLKALEQAEHGWQKAIDKIGERALT